MASKVNSKFVVFLIAAIAVGGILIAGLYYLNMRGNATRNFRIGEEALAAGDLKRARDYIGRAVYKEPGNLQYVAELEKAIVGERPKTKQEAAELYGMYLKTLQHGTRHDASNPQRHLRLIQELVTLARRSNSQWDAVATAAQDMWDGLSPNDPARPLAKAYKCMATFRRVTVSTLDEITQAEQEMRQVVSQAKDNDVVWSTLVLGEMVLAQKLRDQGRSGAVLDQQQDAIDQTLKEATAAVPNGPEVTRMQLLNLALKKASKSESVSEDDINAAAEHLAKVVPDDAEPGLVNESADLLALVPDKGTGLAIAVRERSMAKDPLQEDNRLSLATLYFAADRLDDAQALANKIIDAEPLPVCGLSQAQNDFRTQAAGLIVDIEGRRWASAKPEDRAKFVTQMEAGRKRLASLVSDDHDPVLRKADARIAFAKEDYAKATEIFEQLVRETPLGKDPETLYFAAYCLERLNQPGLALERTNQALDASPGNNALVMMKARLQFNMGQRDDAAKTIADLPEQVRQRPEAQQLLAAIQNANAPQATGSEVASILGKANVALSKGDNDGAISIIADGLSKMPEDIPLLTSMAGVQIRAGHADQAREYLERLRKVDPENANLKQLEAVLKYDDPVDALKAYTESSIPNETDRALVLAGSMRGMIAQQTANAKQLEKKDPTAAAKATAIAAHAQKELETQLARAIQLAPDDPRTIDLQFNLAMDRQDWAAADKILIRAKSLDSDQAGGTLLEGRMHLTKATLNSAAGDNPNARSEFQEAIRSLEKASDRLSFSSAVWRALAMAYQGVGNFSQALSAFEKAYRRNPNDLECVRAYCNLLREQGDEGHALQILRSAHTLAPNDPSIKHMWLFLEDRVGDRMLAVRTRRQMFKENPLDTLNASELARILSDLVPNQNTIVDDSGRPVYSDQRWSRMSPEEREQAMARAQSDWYKESDAILDVIAKNIGDDLNMVMLRANMLRERGAVTAGEELIQKFIAAKDPKDITADMYLELGHYQMRCVHYSDALASFEKALPLQDAQARQADRELADLNMRLRRFDVALQHLNAVLAVKPERALQNQAIECLQQLNRFDESEKLLDQVKQQYGEDMISILLAASIMEGRGDALLAKGDESGARQQYLKQRDMLARAQVQEPTNLKPRLLLAQSYLSEYRRSHDSSVLEDALRVLDEADKVRAGNNDVSMLRASIYEQKGDASAAIGELRRLLDRDPENQSARRELVQLYYDTHQGDAALATVDEAISNNPTLSVWYDAKGDLCKLIKSDPAAALAAYTQAYELAPSAVELSKIADATFAMPNPDCRALATRILSRKEDLESMAFLREALAKSMSCMNMKSDALQELQLAYARRKEVIKGNFVTASEISSWFNAVAYVFHTANGNSVDIPAAEDFIMKTSGGKLDAYESANMAKLWLASGDPKLTRALAYQKKAIDACPDDNRDLKVQLYVDLASYLGSIKNFDDAASAYDSILKIDPKNYQAANNLAYMLAVEAKDVKRALPYAEQAMKLAPDNASVLDTVGWVQYLAGDAATAVKTLQNAVNLQKSPVLHLHLAEAQIAAGDLNAAQTNVDDAFRLDQNGTSRDEIDRLNKVIREKRDARG